MTISDDLLRKLSAGTFTSVGDDTTILLAAELIDARARLAELPKARDVSASPEGGDHEFRDYGIDFECDRARVMAMTIDRLFEESPSPLGQDQDPAIECAIVLRSGTSLLGALSVAKGGALRLAAAEREPGTGLPVAIVEHYFHVDDVVMVAVRRQMNIRTGPGSSSIIHG